MRRHLTTCSTVKVPLSWSAKLKMLSVGIAAGQIRDLMNQFQILGTIDNLIYFVIFIL